MTYLIVAAVVAGFAGPLFFTLWDLPRPSLRRRYVLVDLTTGRVVRRYWRIGRALAASHRAYSDRALRYGVRALTKGSTR